MPTPWSPALLLIASFLSSGLPHMCQRRLVRAASQGSDERGGPQSAEAGMHPGGSLSSWVRTRGPCWPLLGWAGRLEGHEADLTGLAAVQRASLPPGYCSQTLTNPGRAETGNVCTADRPLRASLCRPRWVPKGTPALGPSPTQSTPLI